MNAEMLQALQPQEQMLVMSMVKSFLRLRNTQTEAQLQFRQMRSRYASSELTTEDIDRIIHEEA